MSDILIIGNGFDIHNGLKTKYSDYFEYVNDSIITYEEVQSLKKLKENLSKFINENKLYFDALGGEVTLLDSPSEYRIAYREVELDISVDSEFLYFEDDYLYDIIVNKKINFRGQKDKMHLSKFLYHYIINDEVTSGNKVVIYTRYNHMIEIVSFEDGLYETLNSLKRDVGLESFVFKNEFSLFPSYIKHLQTYVWLRGIENQPTTIKLLENIGENWFDLEAVLFENQFRYLRRTDVNATNRNNFEEYLMKYSDYLSIFSSRTVVEDFKMFKENFIGYIAAQQDAIEKTDDILSLMHKLFEEYNFNMIMNFNYTNYINLYALASGIAVNNIHGDLLVGENIVFGTNHYLFKEAIENINEKSKTNTNIISTVDDEEFYEITKLYQTIKISSNEDTFSVGKVDSITIIGHSIGKQDFEYYHSLIKTNAQDIKINVIWSEGMNNLNDLTKNLYDMLKSYENLYGEIAIHKMIIENRISFKKIEDFELGKDV